VIVKHYKQGQNEYGYVIGLEAAAWPTRRLISPGDID
jgi:hypothetical protein